MIAVDHPLVLAALPLALLPLLTRWLHPCAVPRLDLRPADGSSAWVGRMLTAAGIVGIAALLLGIADLHLQGGKVPYRGSGSNLILLIDRSSSMDDTFAGRTPSGAEESKSVAARRILQDFIAGRRDDRIGVALFSTAPILALPMTTSHSAVTAAINAQAERGLSQTNAGRGLALALDMMAEVSAMGSRAVILVSDGAAVIAPEVQKQLHDQVHERQARLYWLYLRTKGTRSIFDEGAPGEENTPQTRPERHLHLFLQRLGVPYHAYEAENAEAVQQAVNEIDDLESRPIVTERRVPRRDLSWICFLIAAAAAAMLTLARWLERPFAAKDFAPLVRQS